ncbi:MAG: class I SAM-dependent methyltransferase [Opitutaceae bacterium]|nr:class I SAM-dependent methyltransferase [Opitutaceae bacterium]
MNSQEYARLEAAEDAMWYFRALHGHIHRSIKCSFPLRTRLNVLDAGCGTGGLIRRLGRVEPDWAVRGVDHSGEACGLAERLGTTGVRKAAIEALPFRDGEFDVAVSADVFYQVEDPAVALLELHRVLRPGGCLVVTAPAYQWLWSYHDEAVGGKRRFTRKGLTKLFGANGFDPVRSTHWNALTLPLVVVRRKWMKPAPGSGDVAVSSPVVERAMNAIMALEAVPIRMGLSWPWGANLLVTGRRRD